MKINIVIEDAPAALLLDLIHQLKVRCMPPSPPVLWAALPVKQNREVLAFLAAFDRVFFRHGGEAVVRATLPTLEKQVKAHRSLKRALGDIYLGWMLMRLMETHPERVKVVRKKDGRLWEIHPPQKTVKHK